MTRRIYRLLGAVAIAAFGAACKGDPLADTGGTLSRLDLEYTYREVVLGDSARTFAIERDALNTPLPPTATVRSCNAAIATVTTASDAPLQRTGFFIKALTYGSTCVIAEAGALSDTTQVATFPASVSFAGPDTVISGSTGQYTHSYFSATNANVTGQGIPAPVWTSSDTLRAKTTQTGMVSGFDPSVVNLTTTSARGPGTDAINFTRTVFVDPLPFRGTTSALAGVPTDTVRFARAVGAPRFNQGTSLAVTFKFIAIRTFVARKTADSLYVIVPGIGTTGSDNLVIARADSAKTAEKVNFTSNTASFLDHYDVIGNDGFPVAPTNPSITANGDYYVVQHGTCTGGSVSEPGDDCDDFFRVANPSGIDTLRARVQVDWFTGSDVDILWCKNTTCSGPGNVVTGGGATANNPEVSNVKIPPGATWYLWINYFDPVGAASVLSRIRVTGFP
jgi:hypothetical protein